MNTTTRIAAIALSFFAAGAALAEGPITEPVVSTVSTVTRAEVLAELAKARADGTLQRNHSEDVPNVKFTSTRSRAEVRAETLQAIASGELQALNSEQGSFDGRVQAKRVADAATQIAQAAK